MKLIVGLGNPGRRYEGTRHNVGFVVADEVARRWGLSFQPWRGGALVTRAPGEGGGTLVAKPLTFMNLSGDAVGALQRYYKVALDDVLIVLEDVNLPLGRLRGRARGSGGGHNGLGSVIAALGTDEFARLRVGVGRGDPRRALSAHVLARFEADERAAVDDAVHRAANAVETFIAEGIGIVMNRFNAASSALASEEGEQEEEEASDES